MKRRTWILLLAAFTGVSCGNKQDRDNRQPEGPSTQPKEYIEASQIYDALAESGRYSPAETHTSHGRVDWGRGIIVATGQTRAEGRGPREKLRAMRAAEIIAKRNALLIAAGLATQAARRIGDVQAGEIQAEGKVSYAKVLDRKFSPSTRVASVTVEVPMYGVQGVVRVNGEALKVQAAPWRWVVEDPVEEESDLVVIDARGTGFKPLLTPRLVNEAGQVVFDPAGQGGTLGEHHAFVQVLCPGVDPLDHGSFESVVVLRPIKAAKGALVLSDADLKTLMKHADARELLRAGRTVIVVNPAKSPRPE